MLTISRHKGGKILFATKADDRGIITDWSPNAGAAANFDDATADKIAAKFQERVEREEPCGRLVLLRGGRTVREIGEEIPIDLRPLPDEPVDLLTSPYVPTEELAATLPARVDDGRPTIELRLMCRPFTPERIAYISQLRDVSADVADAVKESAAGAKSFLAVKRQLAAHDATNTERLSALRDALRTVKDEEANADLDAPELAPRLRALAERREKIQAEIGTIEGDRASLVSLLERHRPAADAAVRAAVNAARAARADTLRTGIAAAIAGIAEKCRDELNEIHNLLRALIEIETSDGKLAAQAAVRGMLGI